jgi:hypothetical protein
VLEAAVNGQASCLVTLNVRHFKLAASQWHLKLMAPGAFLPAQSGHWLRWLECAKLFRKMAMRVNAPADPKNQEFERAGPRRAPAKDRLRHRQRCAKRRYMVGIFKVE